jgi:hypothetical protein
MKTLPALASLLFFSSPLVLASSLRCGSRLIGPGDSSAELSALCGEPAQVNKGSVYDGVGARGNGIATGTVSETEVETWTYNFGPNQLMERVRIINGVIVQIDSLGYGYNEP